MKWIVLLLFPWILFGALEHASISMYAVDCKTGKVIVNVEEDKSLVPSSCMKLVTTGAAFYLLGKEAQFKTTLELEGPVEEGILHGNVIIRGGGDPCLGSDRTQGSLGAEKQIEVWVSAIKEQGIKEIRGEIIGDASLWESAQAPPSWAWEDLGNYYGAGASALSFHENMSVVTFKPGSGEGSCATLLRVVPAAKNYVLQNEVKTGAVGSGDQACIYGSEYAMTQVVRGTIPLGVPEFSIKGSIPDPAALCSELLKEALEKSGVKVKGGISKQKHDRRVIHTTLSPSVQEIIYWTNQKSINLYAEHLLKGMGEGSTARGVQKVMEFWKAQGIDLKGMNMADGSGVSRKNFVTAKQLVSILNFMKNSPYFSEFYASLREESGAFAKSGTMSFVRCLAGYKGDTAFAILINYGQDPQEARAKIDQFLTELPSILSAKAVRIVSSTSL